MPVRADQHRSARARLYQAHAPEDQGPHDLLAQLRFGDHQAAQALGRNDQGLHVGRGPRIDEGGPAGKLAHLRQEMALAIGPDRLVMAKPVPACHLHAAREEDQHAQARLAGADQIVALGEPARLAEAAQPLDLMILQREVHLLPPRPDHRRRILGHGLAPRVREQAEHPSTRLSTLAAL